MYSKFAVGKPKEYIFVGAYNYRAPQFYGKKLYKPTTVKEYTKIIESLKIGFKAQLDRHKYEGKNEKFFVPEGAAPFFKELNTAYHGDALSKVQQAIKTVRLIKNISIHSNSALTFALSYLQAEQEYIKKVDQNWLANDLLHFLVQYIKTDGEFAASLRFVRDVKDTDYEPVVLETWAAMRVLDMIDRTTGAPFFANEHAMETAITAADKFRNLKIKEYTIGDLTKVGPPRPYKMRFKLPNNTKPVIVNSQPDEHTVVERQKEWWEKLLRS